jgi:hypothetical protein
MAEYYGKVGISVSQIYRNFGFNFSLWTVGWRIFEGTSLDLWGGANVPPLFNAPALAPFVSLAIPFAILILACLFSFRAGTLDTSFGLLICLIILVSPVAWSHFLILALIPLVIVIRKLASLNWPCKETSIAIFIGITFSFFAGQLMPLLTGDRLAAGLLPTLSFTVGVLTFLPAIGLLGLMWLVWRLDRFTPQVLRASGKLTFWCGPRKSSGNPDRSVGGNGKDSR